MQGSVFMGLYVLRIVERNNEAFTEETEINADLNVSQNMRSRKVILDEINRRNKGMECTHGEKDACLVIAEGPENLTKDLEIDIMGTRKPPKVTEALLVSFSQEHFLFEQQMGVFFHPEQENGNRIVLV
jgi:hypothetical protein